jgi:N-methylhydantoinase B
VWRRYLLREILSTRFSRASGRRTSQWELDEEATEEQRTNIRNNRIGWLDEDPAELAKRYQEGKVGTFELIRRHGVILDWGTGELLPKTTEGFRAMLERRVVPHWKNGTRESQGE